MYREEQKQQRERFETQQWLAYYGAWLQAPVPKGRQKPKLITLGEFFERGEKAAKSKAATFEQAEEAGITARERLKRGGKII